MEQAASSSNIPPVRADGFVPEGGYVCSEAEVVFRCGSSSRRRRRLVLRLHSMITHAEQYHQAQEELHQ